MSIHPLSQVCCQRNPDPQSQRAQIEKLLDEGADLHETDKNGVTPLHHAVRFRSPAAVATLLARGAAVNQVCRRSGSTALHRAGKRAETRQIIELLLQHGADPSIANRQGKTAADYVRDEEIRHLLCGR